MAKSEIDRFRRLVWDYARRHGRHDLPWRRTHDPYRILVSEIMLQQTQVERVKPFYKDFIRRFPTARSLAKAPLGDVLRAWQGLGYNRRAKHLRAATAAMTKRMPRSVVEFEELPGVGPYTARAVAAFAHNTDVVFVETNIRTAVLHHFFKRARGRVSDTKLEAILIEALPQGQARAWYSALMDYGAHLKRSGVRVNAKSAHYVKQGRFAGSDREARGAILRELAKRSSIEATLALLLGRARGAQLRRALMALRAEGLVQNRGKRYALAR